MNKIKTALITGVTGQDGSYLAELLLEKGYMVHGLVRRSSSFNTGRIDHVIETQDHKNFEFHRADLTDGSSLARIFRKVQPDEIYNLGAQSHVAVSFEIPEYTTDVVALGPVRLLESVRDADISPRIYQAGSSEMYGNAPAPQSETTPMVPCSPYAVAKLAAYRMAQVYREAYGMWIANGILFNHESPRRGETFVTRKITRAVARIALGVQEKLRLGNLDARRDWGYAPEYVAAMWRILQHEKPDDFVIATGRSCSVREFVNAAFTHAGLDADDHVVVDPKYYRPLEVHDLIGDASKARDELGWQAHVDLEELVKIMVDADMKRERLLLEGTRAHEVTWMSHI